MPDRPTYVPDCDCHKAGVFRSSMFEATPDQRIDDLEQEAANAVYLPLPLYLFRSAVSWDLTPIGYR